MNLINHIIDIDNLIKLTQDAGKAILEVYNSEDFEVQIKSDNSPLTIADKRSNKIITDGLTEYYPEIPIISEEGKSIDYSVRKNWDKFWLVDPLDGTKEFINKNGEFTVNIALIENNIPICGVIYIPCTKEIFYGSALTGSFKINPHGIKEEIFVSVKDFSNPINVVQSRTHSGDEENEFYSKYKINERVSKGSSLKICLVAEGKAELYFRGGPTWEWDTAAGHAILISAGGYFLNKDKSKLVYNKKDLKNYGFIASSKKI